MGSRYNILLSFCLGLIAIVNFIRMIQTCILYICFKIKSVFYQFFLLLSSLFVMSTILPT
nr:hypothetical protein [uncultured bacterium]